LKETVCVLVGGVQELFKELLASLESAATLEMAPTASYHSEGYEVIAGTNH
jgi:hypothetical protein